MSPLFESIACTNRVLDNIQFHEERMNRSRAELFGLNEPISLDRIEIPEFVNSGLWKCRVSYSREIEAVEFNKYSSANPQTFKLIDASIAYPHKFENRGELNTLFSQRQDADEIIIVVDNLITDSSIANLVFYDGKQWFTPAEPLLPGTMRANLLASGVVKEAKISKDDLSRFELFMPINALTPFDANRALPIGNIVY